VLGFLRRCIDAIGTLWLLLGWFGLSTTIVSLLTVVGGSAWAMATGIAAPIVLMAAFCTITAGAYLALVPMAYRALQRAQDSPTRVRPDPEIWRHMPRLKLYEAACLLADVEPDIPIVSRPGDPNGWYRALCEAVRDNELAHVPTAFDSQHTYAEGYRPYEETVVGRVGLQRFAANRGAKRAFLSD
jgi:hypothetical protein